MANKQKIDLKKFIPSNLQNELNTSLADNLFNRFLAEEQSVVVSGQVGKITDSSKAVIQASDLDRELNALVPAFYFKTGTEESLFTFNDLLSRMKALGVDVNNLKSSLSEQSLNLAPPINLDKFINYSNYYWTAIDAKPTRFTTNTMSWNSNLLPEFYLINRPADTSTVKLPVNLATTQDIKLYGKGRNPETITIKFQNSTNFTISGSNGSLFVNTTSAVSTQTSGTLTGAKTKFYVSGPNNLALFSFQITQGSEVFEVDDTFTIDITYVTGSNTVSFTPGPSLTTLNKGFISNIIADSQLMSIDGVQLIVGDTVLVKNQTNSAENGVYLVKSDKWLRLSSYSKAEHFPIGTRIYISFGSQAGKTFELTSNVNALGSDPLVFASVVGNPPLAVNEWQIYNFWVHKDDLDPSYTNAVQATRPIIEYDNDLRLNAAFNNEGYPSESGTAAQQIKTRFNQIPQFDLYYYDGHHAKKTSGIFFYEEDPDYDVDSVLLRRVKQTVNADYVFGLGIKDEDGRLLFFKKNNVISSIWAPGNTTPTMMSLQLTAESADLKGTISGTINATADNQTWTLKAINPNQFSVVGSRSGDMGVAIVNVPFTAPDDFTITITTGSVPFAAGDVFTFNVIGPVSPRFAKKLSDGNIVNVVGGPLGDVNNEGTWMVPRRMFENMMRTLSTEISFGDLVDHYRSIIKSQDGFTGSSFGTNNYRALEVNHGIGGNIREYSGNFPLLASLLMQNGMSPLSIVDFGEHQYATALASIDQFLSNELANYIANTDAPVLNGISASDGHIQLLLSNFESLRANDQVLRDVFNDSTAKVKNWPVTLPMMGIVPKAIPTIRFDDELGIDVIVHHDNHRSPLAQVDYDFDRNLVRTIVTRSNGEENAGVFSETAPSLPYARQLWFKPSTNELKVFDVKYDSSITPIDGNAGDVWFNRNTSELKEWDIQSSTWVSSTQTVSSRWVLMNTSAIRNSLVLAVENKLYDSVHPSITVKANLAQFASDSLAAIELAKFSAKYGYDTFASIFNQADAFTWNYKQAFGHSRWFDVYADYFLNAVGVAVKRPNLEPWKLLGFTSKPSNWDATYAGTNRMWSTVMWTDIMAAKPGLKVCVDINTDALLPPYVSAALPESQYALTTVKPQGIADTYTFLDNGPVENVWKKSLEYSYGLVRVYFKREPLRFVESLWGDTFMSTGANDIRLERNLMQAQSPSKFLLHGERLHNVVQRNATSHFIISGSVVSTATAQVKFEVSHVEDNETYFYAYVNGTLKGIVEEGQNFSFSQDGVTFTNVLIDDMGIPFSIGDVFNINFVASPDPSVEPPPVIDPEDCGCVIPGSNDTLPFPAVIVSSTWTFTPSLVNKLNGLGQLYTNLLRFNYIDLDMSSATNAYRGWDVRLAHRIGALIRGDSLKIETALGSLPDTAYSLLLKRSEYLDSKWISALRIQLVQQGKRISNSVGNYIPVGKGEDWIFRLETYNPQNPLIEYYSYDLAGEYLTFNALLSENTKEEWKHYTKHASLNLVTTPIAVTGIQNLINIIFGYVERLDELGFKINTSNDATIDFETGRNLDWQLEVEKLIDRVYSNMGPGTGHILNPFMSSLFVKTPIGLMSRYTENQFIDVASTQAVFDVNGKVIPMSDLYVVRTDDSATTYSNTPIFSGHLFNDEFEHVILFNAKLSDEIGSSTIFDQFLGIRIDTANLSYTRQAEVDRKPNFHGFVLNGNDVRRNIVSSVDSIANYYDVSKTFYEPTTAKHALSLLGFNKKDYFSNIGISDATQFNFWRGLIQAKGTNMSVDAFVNYKKFTDASVDEYWAYKVAEYGDARMNSLPEIKVEQADCQQSFTQLQFYDQDDSTYSPLDQFIQIETEDDARWFSIDDLGEGLVFDAQPISETINATSAGYYKLSNIFHNGDAGEPTVTKNGVVTADATIINAKLLKVVVPGNYVVNGYTWANPVKQSPVKLFDYKANTLVKQIALWHPAIGIHAYEPLEIINTISPTDPALYSYSTQTTNNANLSTLRPWGRKEVGRVWWDTDNLGYVAYYDAAIYPNRNERNARWGSLAEWATVDLYEWTESPVHPSEYDDLALSQQGTLDIPVEQRASGKAAKKSFYKRDREISIRPIAWSKAGVGDQDAHPAFGPAVSTKVYYAGGALFADSGRCATINLVEDRHFGGWINNKPSGEVVITDQVVYDLGSSTSLSTPLLNGITISIIDGGRLGTRIGQINLIARTAPDSTEYLRMYDDFGFSQELEIPSFNGVSGDFRSISFDQFGISLNVDAMSTADEIATGWNNVYVREGVRAIEIIALPDYVFTNDETDADYLTHDYEWRAWDVPSQEDLDSDLSPPRNTWMPYVGDLVEITPSADVVNLMGVADLVLKSGITISRYTSTWTDWVKQETVKVEKISDGQNLVSFISTDFTDGSQLDGNRLSVYANGVQLNPQTYIVSGVIGTEVVEIVNILPEGTPVLLIYRAYQPTLEELEFDPDAKDDPTVLTQYKADYQYTKVDVRNEAGVITSAKYYFWVQEKTVIQQNKSMSLVQAKSILTNGPSQFMMFARLENGNFDSCVIAGLNNLVTNNDTYKLRFQRNHTLRDDPEQLNLKNTHTEWALIRRSQSSRIPKSLWDQLANAAAAHDAAGNPLPSKTRIDYDVRNGTRTRFGFKSGQIFADTELVRKSIINTILNTSLTIKLGAISIPDYITALDLEKSDEWFANDESSRVTMNLIWTTARPRQINEIFFEVLEDALASNYEFSDIFKTSLISVYSTTKVEEQVEGEIEDGEF